jgi:coenzyme F420-reducing hydrogenase beta subunit
MQWDKSGHRMPKGAGHARRSAAFARTCPFSPHAITEDQIAALHFSDAPWSDRFIGRSRAAYVGYVREGNFRASGSSGGMVTWVAAELLRRGLADGVLHVVPEDPVRDGRLFRYRISRSEAEIRGGAGSRYYPVDLAEVLAEVRRVPGRYAMIGIPCFVKAVQLLRRDDPVIRDRIVFTLGLFCGHMKSAHFAASIARQLGADPEAVRAIDYRLKNAGRPANWYTAQLLLDDGSTRTRDWWHLADGDWGAGFFQNSACDFCDDVAAETADISFGDAWQEPYSSDGRGTNVLVIRSPVLHGLIETGIAGGALALEAVDSRFVRDTQAAGFRQRREGLAYRLTWRRRGIKPRKRVAPSRNIAARRKLIYRMRAGIAAWSERLFRLSVRLGWPRLYIGWAWATRTVYHGIAYGKIVLRR